MTDFKGRVAFITGGASGLGLSMARAFGARGASVMLADIQADRLAEAEALLKGAGVEVASVGCDVADEASVRAAAQATLDRFGKVHIVANNAGVSVVGRAGKVGLKNWRWVVDINLMGVAHGVEIFLPILRNQGEGGHFLNTASMAGHGAAAGMGPYNATKFAVVGYSESMQQELVEEDIQVSVLCPAFVKTNIAHSELQSPGLRLPPEEARKSKRFQKIKEAVEGGLEADAVGEWVAECMEANRFYIFTHPELRPGLEARYAAIMADYQAIADDGRFG
ncbi:MAG: SDR family NAD(P)-dependent oxidoreductase [Myxococcota bacterium]